MKQPSQLQLQFYFYIALSVMLLLTCLAIVIFKPLPLGTMSELKRITQDLNQSKNKVSNKQKLFEELNYYTQQKKTLSAHLINGDTEAHAFESIQQKLQTLLPESENHSLLECKRLSQEKLSNELTAIHIQASFLSTPENMIKTIYTLEYNPHIFQITGITIEPQSSGKINVILQLSVLCEK